MKTQWMNRTRSKYTAEMAMEDLEKRLGILEADVERNSGDARFEAEWNLENALN
jgi:hypothetical protein